MGGNTLDHCQLVCFGCHHTYLYKELCWKGLPNYPPNENRVVKVARLISTRCWAVKVTMLPFTGNCDGIRVVNLSRLNFTVPCARELFCGGHNADVYREQCLKQTVPLLQEVGLPALLYSPPIWTDTLVPQNKQFKEKPISIQEELFHLWVFPTSSDFYQYVHWARTLGI